MCFRLLPYCLLVVYLVGSGFHQMTQAQGQPHSQSLITLISQLRERGYNIIYSDSLVLPAMKAAAIQVSMQTLKQSLQPYGLRLLQQDNIWIISVSNQPVKKKQSTFQKKANTELVLENVIVTGSIHSFPESNMSSTAHRLLKGEMNQVPSLGSDVMRAMVRMPGVSSVGVSAKPRIRGGLQDELLVLQDGIELLEPFHLADYHSAYSAIDYHTIESVDFYTGGFPSRYGNRISGVMDISNQWSKDEYNTDIGMSTFSYFVNTRSDEPKDALATSWLLSFRQGNLHDLTDYIETRSGQPTYQDLSARINSDLTPYSAVSAGIVVSEDDIVFDDLEERASSQINSQYAWSRLEKNFSSTLQTTMALSYIHFEREKNEFSFEIDDEEEENPDPFKNGSLYHLQQVERLALRNDYTKTGLEHILEFGWQAEYAWSQYRHRSEINRGELADILGVDRDITRDIAIEPKGGSGGLYLAAEFDLSTRWLVQPSMRWDYQDYYREGGETQFSPRMGAAYEFSERGRISMSLGRFYQPEGIHELQVLDGETSFFRPQYADQAMLGVEWSNSQLHMNGEVYCKRYRELKTRYENVFNPFVLLPEMEPDRVPLSPQKAFARGIDLSLKYTFTGHLSWQFRYSAMDAEDKINDRWVPRRWSQDQTINTLLAWEKNNYNASFAIVWHSGWYSSKMPALVSVDSQVALESALNNTELKDYFSLDISLRKSWRLEDTFLQIYIDVTNVTDRNNIAGIDYDIDLLESTSGDSIAFELNPDRETLLSMVPSIGFILSF